MGNVSAISLRRILIFAAFVELGTGLALIIDPAVVVALLLGAEISGVGMVLSRCFGIGLLSFGLACWPGGRGGASGSSAARGMLVYNALIALYLAYLGAVARNRGMLLWPGVMLHAVVALLVLWRTWRDEHPITAIRR